MRIKLDMGRVWLMRGLLEWALVAILGEYKRTMGIIVTMETNIAKEGKMWILTTRSPLMLSFGMFKGGQILKLRVIIRSVE